ncbi:unnamed protein product [Pylaiella littoralis]
MPAQPLFQEKTSIYEHARQGCISRPPRRPRSSERKEALVATNPRDLERFVDSSTFRQGGQNQAGIECPEARRGSRLAAKSSMTATSISWDGLTLDPRPFARFDEHGTLTCGKKPAGSAGVRVIELERHAPGGIFGRPATGPGRMQWTVEQETSRLLAPDNPFKQAARDGGGVAVDRPYFDSALTIVPKVKIVRPPTCISRAGPQGDRALLAPEERREMNDYETKMQAAERVGRKAEHQKTRQANDPGSPHSLHFIMKHRYSEGAIGVDSPFNPASEVYAERRIDREKNETLSCAQAAARRQRLDGIRGNPRPRFGYDPWQHPDLPPDGGIQEGMYGGVDASSEVWGAVKPAKRNGGEHFMQTKVRSGKGSDDQTKLPKGGRPGQGGQTQQYQHCPDGSRASVRSETFRTILGVRQKVPKSDPRVRSQALWDEACGRRSYNIVSGAQLPLPAAKAERPPGRLAHPSQQSLERGRNLQGSLIPA